MVALFLLSQVFLIISHSPLVQTLACIILRTDRTVFEKGIFLHGRVHLINFVVISGVNKLLEHYELEKKLLDESLSDEASGLSSKESSSSKEMLVEDLRNITDEEKLAKNPCDSVATEKPFLETVYSALDCSENDYAALFALCLLYAMANNKGIVKWLALFFYTFLWCIGVTSDVLEQALKPKKSFISKSSTKDIKYSYNVYLLEKLLSIISSACQPTCR